MARMKGPNFQLKLIIMADFKKLKDPGFGWTHVFEFKPILNLTTRFDKTQYHNLQN